MIIFKNKIKLYELLVDFIIIFKRIILSLRILYYKINNFTSCFHLKKKEKNQIEIFLQYGDFSLGLFGLSVCLLGLHCYKIRQQQKKYHHHRPNNTFPFYKLGLQWVSIKIRDFSL